MYIWVKGVYGKKLTTSALRQQPVLGIKKNSKTMESHYWLYEDTKVVKLLE